MSPKGVNKVTQRKKPQQLRGTGKNHPITNSEDSRNCSRCGLARHTEAKRCPALNSKCRRCGRTGHWDKKCRTRRVQYIEEKTTSNQAFLDSVCDSSENRDFKVKILIPEFVKQIDFVIDTGADVSCISSIDIPDCYRNKIVRSNRSILGLTGRN